MLLLHLITVTDTLGRTTLDEGSARCRDHYVATQRTEETNIHVPGGIRTRSPMKLAAVDPRLLECAATGVGRAHVTFTN